MKTEGRPGFNPQPKAAAPAQVDPTSEALASLGGARGMVRTSTAYQTAVVVQKPRDRAKVIEDILFEAGEMGEDFIYSWRQRTNDKNLDEGDGKVTIEGLSINGAMILIRCWGNAVLPTDLVEETPSHYLFCATFIDLETGFTLPRLFRQRKSQKVGKMDGDRSEDIAFQIGQSKAQRNAIDKGFPAWLREKAIAASKDSAAAKYADLTKWVPLFIQRFSEKGVSKAQMEKRVGKPADIWSSYDLLRFSLIAKAVQEGETTIGDEFPKPQEDAPPADAGAAATDQGTTVDTTGTVTSETTEPFQDKAEPSPTTQGTTSPPVAQAQAANTAAPPAANTDPDWMQEPKPEPKPAAKKPAEPAFVPPKPKS